MHLAYINKQLLASVIGINSTSPSFTCRLPPRNFMAFVQYGLFFTLLFFRFYIIDDFDLEVIYFDVYTDVLKELVMI